MLNQIKIWITDDHQLVRQGFRVLLEQFEFIEIIGESPDGKSLMHALRDGARPEVILMDVEMPVMGGLEALEHIKREYFGIKIILLTMLNDREIIQKAHELDADGFLFKNTSPAELTDAIKKVKSNQKYFAPDVALTLLNKNPAPVSMENLHLSSREVEILKLIAEGLSSTEIGAQLFISPRTVDTHRNNLIQKLGVSGVVGLVRFAIQHKIVN